MEYRRTRILLSTAAVVLLSALSLCLPVSALSATIYVETTGNDGNDGSSAHPWRTMAKAEASAVTGDTVHVETGTYQEGDAVGSTSGCITFSKGVAWIADGGPVTIRSFHRDWDGRIASIDTGDAALSMDGFIFDADIADQGTPLDGLSVSASCENVTLSSGGTDYELEVDDNVHLTLDSFSINPCGMAAVVLFGSHDSLTMKDCAVVNSSQMAAVYGDANAINVVGGSFAFNTSTLTPSPVIGNTGTNRISITNADFTFNADTTNGTCGITIISNTGPGWVTVDNSRFGDPFGELSTGSKLIGVSSGTVSILNHSAFTTHHVTTGSDLITISSAGVLNIDGGASDSEHATFVIGVSGPEADVIDNSGTGAVSVKNSTWTVDRVVGASTPPAFFYHDSAESRRASAGDLTFEHNTFTFGTKFEGVDGQGHRAGVFFVEKRDGNLAMNHNQITMTDNANPNSLVCLRDVRNLIYTHNTSSTAVPAPGCPGETHLSLLPEDPAPSPPLGTVNISHNTFNSHSLAGYIIDLGEETSTGPSFDNRWQGSTIENNDIYGANYFNPDLPLLDGQGNPAVTTHAVLVGQSIKSTIARNYVNGAGYGFVIKGSSSRDDWNHQGGVFDNLVVNNTYIGIYDKGVIGLNVVNNTVYADRPICEAGIKVGWNDLGENGGSFATGARVYNNIVSLYGEGQDALCVYDDGNARRQGSLTGFCSDYNVFYNNSGGYVQFHWGYSACTSRGMTVWQSVSGQDAHSLVADPLFVSSAARDYHLMTESQCINAADNVAAGISATDKDGRPRVYDGTVDIGAYEFSGSPQLPGLSITPGSGIYDSPQNVVMTCDIPGAELHYTTTGDDPTETDLAVTGPVLVDQNMTLKARAFKADWTPSDVKSASYSFQVGTPAFSPGGGVYDLALSVEITSATSGAVIHYTDTGVDPTESDAVVTGPILVDKSMTLKAKAWRTGWATSTVSSASYTVYDIVPPLSSAKAQPNNSSANVPLAVVTAAANADLFYVEADDRSCGILVSKVDHGLTPGEKVTIEGIARTMSWGEKYVDATSVTIAGTGTIRPLALSNRDVGGGDWFYNSITRGGQKGVKDFAGGDPNRIAYSSALNNIGMLITTTGKVTYSTTEYFYIDDGYGLADNSGHIGIKVLGSVPPPDPLPPGWTPVGHYVTVTGISSCFKPTFFSTNLYRQIWCSQVTLEP